MATERINDLIDEKAFKDLERLVSLLTNAENKMVDATKTAIAFNNAVANSKTAKEFTDASNGASKAVEGFSKAQQEAGKNLSDVNKQIEATVKISKENILSNQQQAKILEKYTGDIDQHIRRQVQLKLELKAVQTEQKELAKSAASSEKSVGALAKKTQDLAKHEAELKAALQESNAEVKRSIKESLSAEGSYTQLSARLDSLRLAYKGLNQEERESAEVGGVLLKAIQESDAELKKLDAKQGVYTRNVGNYTMAVNDLKGSFISLIPGAQGVAQAFEQGQTALNALRTIVTGYVVGTQQATVSTEGMTVVQKASIFTMQGMAGALKILRIALISTGIGAIIVLLGSFVAYLASTQEGIDKVTSVTRPLVAIFQSLLGVAQKVGKAVFDAFSNPKQLLKDLGDLILTNIINRFKALGVIVEGLVKMDFNKFNEGLFQAVTGVEKFTDKIQKGAQQAGKFIADAAKRGSEIDRLTKEIEAAQIRFQANQIKVNDLVDEQLLISKDTSRSFKEREKASQTIIALRKKEGEEEAGIIKKKIQRLQIEQSLNDKGRAGQKEMVDLQTELDAAQDRGLDAQKEQMRVISGARKEQNAQAKAAQEAELDRIKEVNRSLAELEQSRLQRAIDRNTAVVDDEKLAFEDRLSNLDDYIANQEKLIKSQTKQELSDKNLLEADRTRIQEESDAKITGLAAIKAKKLADILKGQLAEEDRIRIEADQKRINTLDAERDTKLLELDKEFSAGRLSGKEDYEKKRLEILKFYSQLVIDEEIRQTEAVIALQKARGQDTSAAEAKLAALKIKYSKEATDAQLKDLDTLAKKEEALKAAKKQLNAELKEVGISLINGVFDARKNEIQQQIDSVDIAKNAEIEKVNNSLASEEEKANKIKIIEARSAAQKEMLDKRARDMAVKQAKFQKAVSISSIIQQTALAVMTALGPPPYGLGAILGSPLALTVAAIGAAQVAQVLATPIPKFEVGTNYSPEGPAWVGEKGTELRIDPSGKYSLTPDKPSLTYLEKGTKIVSNQELMKMISKPEKVTHVGGQAIDISRLVHTQENSTRELKEALKSIKPGRSQIITEGGMKYIHTKGSKWTRYINRNFN